MSEFDFVPRSIRILYRNYRGEVAIRRIKPRAIYWGSNEHHKPYQWLLDCYDLDKEAARTYAMKDILAWGDEAIAAVLLG